MENRWWVLVLLAYLLAAFGWWTYLLYSTNTELADAQKELWQVHRKEAVVDVARRFQTTLLSDSSFILQTGQQKGNLLSYLRLHHPKMQLNILPSNETAFVLRPSAEVLKVQRRLAIDRPWMFLMEGLVMFTLLLVGVSRVWRSFAERLKLAERQDNFLLSVSHELKSPLASLKMGLQTLARPNIPLEKKTPFIDNGLRDVKRLEHLVSNLLTSAHEGTQLAVSEKSKIEIAPLIAQVLAQLCEGTAHPAEVHLAIEDDLCVFAHEDSLRMALWNLLDNAFKYAALKPITVSAKRKGPVVEIRVSDAGIGIAPEHKANIFKKFYRIGNELTRTTPGTGLGLYLAKMLLEQNDATLAYEASMPQGATFIITFAYAA